jgi:hypothetical protein
MDEHLVANEKVAGSMPVIRSRMAPFAIIVAD